MYGDLGLMHDALMRFAFQGGFEPFQTVSLSAGMPVAVLAMVVYVG